MPAMNLDETKPGEVLPAEKSTFADRKSGVMVTRYTARQSHSHHCYFNVDGSWDGGRQVVISRDDGQGAALFSLNLASGEFTRLTPSILHGSLAASVCASREEAYFWSDDALWSAHLREHTLRRVTALPAGFEGQNTAVTSDGSAVVTALFERTGESDVQPSTEVRMEMLKRPRRTRVVEISLTDGTIRTLHESAEHFLGHANPSPTDPDLLTFCHEGPWLEIGQRIWGLRRSGGQPWPIVPRDPDWGVGHEFWLADGQTIGYHARYMGDKWRHALGWAKADNSACFQAEVAVPTHHAHARQRDLYVLDGTRSAGDYLFVVERDGTGWAKPRILCAHDTSRWHHRAHAHPHLCADGKTVLFTSDRGDYCDVYAVTIPDKPDTLPAYKNPPYRFYWE
jgi:oligogalacturonide lyase